MIQYRSISCVNRSALVSNNKPMIFVCTGGVVVAGVGIVNHRCSLTQTSYMQPREKPDGCDYLWCTCRRSWQTPDNQSEFEWFSTSKSVSTRSMNKLVVHRHPPHMGCPGHSFVLRLSPLIVALSFRPSHDTSSYFPVDAPAP